MQNYLDQAGNMIADKKLEDSGDAKENEGARSHLQVRTLMILRRFGPRSDGETLESMGYAQKRTPKERPFGLSRAKLLPLLGPDRRADVLTFLYRADLISKENPKIELKGAYLTEAKLVGINLDGASLRGVPLKRAILAEATLTGQPGRRQPGWRQLDPSQPDRH